MKKQLILIGITVLLIFVGLSGCSEIKSTSETDLISINYYLYDGWNYAEGLEPKIVSWSILGNATNTHSKMADYVQITGEFYDENDVLLYHKTVAIENIRSGQTVAFGAKNELDPDTPYILNFNLFGSDYNRDTFPQNVHVECFVNYVDFYDE